MAIEGKRYVQSKGKNASWKSLVLIALPILALSGALAWWVNQVMTESFEQMSATLGNPGCADFGDGSETCCPDEAHTLYRLEDDQWTHLYCVRHTGWEGEGIYGPWRNRAHGPHAVLENGKRWRRGQYSDGVRQGTWSHWDEEGNQTDYEYRHGQICCPTEPGEGCPSCESIAEPQELSCPEASVPGWSWSAEEGRTEYCKKAPPEWPGGKVPDPSTTSIRGGGKWLGPYLQWGANGRLEVQGAYRGGIACGDFSFWSGGQPMSLPSTWQTILSDCEATPEGARCAPCDG